MRPDKAGLTELHAMALIENGGERLFDRLNCVSNGWVEGEVVRSWYRSMAAAFSRGDPSYMNHVCDLWMVLAVELWLSVVFLGISEPFKHLTASK